MEQNLQYEQILLSTACFPTISYIKSILCSHHVYIEQNENYIKQTYRNRYNIYAANGLLSLSVPVNFATNKKILIKDVRIDYDTNWQKQHFKSIESAYRSAPFYEFLIDDFMPFFNEKHTFLLDFNYSVLLTIFKILEINNNIVLSSDFEKNPVSKFDIRNAIHPKKENLFSTNFNEYPQVFADKHGFKKDLSFLDLLFNLGGEAYSYLIDKY